MFELIALIESDAANEPNDEPEVPKNSVGPETPSEPSLPVSNSDPFTFSDHYIYAHGVNQYLSPPAYESEPRQSIQGIEKSGPEFISYPNKARTRFLFRVDRPGLLNVATTHT